MSDYMNIDMNFGDDNDFISESFTGTTGSFTDFMNGKFMSFHPDNIIGAKGMASGMFSIDIEDTELAINYNFQGKDDPGLTRPGRLM